MIQCEMKDERCDLNVQRYCASLDENVTTAVRSILFARYAMKLIYTITDTGDNHFALFT